MKYPNSFYFLKYNTTSVHKVRGIGIKCTINTGVPRP